MVTKRTEELLKKDVAHFIHPHGVVGQAPGIIWERGKGAQLWDTDGKQYTDMLAGCAHCTNLGFGRKELIDAAHEEMQKSPHLLTSGNTSNIPAIEYAAELAEVLPGDINHVYFNISGGDANEVAIQIARQYWRARGEGDRYKLVCLTRGYHGSTALTNSLGARGISCFGREYPGILRIPNYYCYHCPFDLKYPSCNIACARFLESVIEEERAETIVAFIAEPVQGQGAMWPPDEYWPMVRKICSDRNILLIADCVQTGFCRTGKFWGMENWNVVPDIMTMSKGINGGYLPFGAVGVSDRVYKDLAGQLLMSESTTAVNPTCIATARAALKIYTEEKLAERSAKLGEHLHERLVKEFLPLPCVGDVRGRGLMQAFEVDLHKTTGNKYNPEAMKKASKFVSSRLQEGGVFAAGFSYQRGLMITPPLTIPEDEFDAALDTMLSVMKEVKPV